VCRSGGDILSSVGVGGWYGIDKTDGGRWWTEGTRVNGKSETGLESRPAKIGQKKKELIRINNE